MLTGQERVIYGNVRNDGLIPNLPDGGCVEVPCLVDATACSRPPWPATAQLAALNRTFLNVCELTVRAALEAAATTSATRPCSTRRRRRRCHRSRSTTWWRS